MHRPSFIPGANTIQFSLRHCGAAHPLPRCTADHHKYPNTMTPARHTALATPKQLNWAQS
ncbi:hypothetical protein BC827DRAFT_247381 [Russula dissimulans]|nr:hypothetical protein BC827DRAFT_247381 [Russula dissimulans]